MAAEPTTSAFLFADLAGFTALTEAHGDAEAAEIAVEFVARVREMIPDYGCELVKTIGDAVMVRLDDPNQAIDLGLRIVDELARPGKPPVRVGVHCGSAVPHEDDWFGGTVNLASRVTGAARVGEVLITEATRRCLGRDGYDLEPRGEHRFRHIVDPVRVYRVIGGGGAGHHLEIDPVCWMAVDPKAPFATRRHRGATYRFCSAECERAFMANPGRYAAEPAARTVSQRSLLIALGGFLAVGVIAAVVGRRAVS
jgi:adenylate cyclase